MSPMQLIRLNNKKYKQIDQMIKTYAICIGNIKHDTINAFRCRHNIFLKNKKRNSINHFLHNKKKLYMRDIITLICLYLILIYIVVY